MTAEKTEDYGGPRPPGFFETKSYKDVRWRATQDASQLPDVASAEAVRRFMTQRIGPISSEMGNQLSPPPKPATYTIPKIVYTYIDRIACIITQYPWMKEPVIYLYEEVHGEEKPSPEGREQTDG